jgi:hypothetical protein
LLTDDHKEKRVEISQEDLANPNENFLKNITTGDETWICGMRRNQDAILAVDGERVSSTKKKKRDQWSKIKALLVMFLDL